MLTPLAGPAQAAPTHLHYVVYSTGFRVLDITTDLDLGSLGYSVAMSLRTVGLFGVLVHGASDSTVTGAWAGAAAAPSAYESHGMWRGNPRRTAIRYEDGQPTVLAMVPDNADEREPVSPPLQANTVDSLSAMAVLLHTVATTGRCDGHSRVYDGRRLSEVAATTVGEDVVPPSERSGFAGSALRCDFTGTLLAGFRYEDDRARAARPQHGTAWFAALRPGGELMPVRVHFATPFFGDAILYLAPP